MEKETQKDITAKIRKRKADYVLALKGNQGTLHDDVKDFFDDQALSSECLAHMDTHLGHGRIEERVCRVAKARLWLTERHPD